MKILNKYYMDVIKDQFSPINIFMNFINAKLKKLNIKLSKRQINKINKSFEKGKLEIQITDYQIKKSGKSEEEIQSQLDSITDELEKYIDEYESKIESKVKTFAIDISDELSQIIYNNLDKTFSSFSKIKEKNLDIIKKDIKQNWNKSFKYLNMILYITHEIIESFETKDEIYYTSKNLVLIKLMSKGCLILSEIITLLENGYSDGAYARWRSLHEITVIAEYLSNKSEEIYEKFIDHQFVQDYKHAIKLKENSNHIFQFEISDEEYKIICDNYKCVIEKYGKPFKNDYGWAHDLFDKKRIYFSDIENEVNFDYIRSHYKMSSDTIHTNSRGLFYNVGFLAKSDYDLLIGPSMDGLSIPLSLVSTSIALLNTNILLQLNDEVLMDDLVYMKIYHILRENIVSNCFDVEENISIVNDDKS